MVDQWAVVTFNTPVDATAPNRDVDVTSPLITEPFSAAVLIFTREQTDSADNTHGVLGIGFIGVDGLTAESSRDCAISAQIENGEDVGQDCNTVRSNLSALRVGAGDTSTVVIEAAYQASIAGGFTLRFSTVNLTGGPAGGPVRAKCTAILFAGLAKAATGACTASDEGAHQNVGAAADRFEPNLVIFRSSDNAVNANTANATLALGFALNLPGLPQVSSYVNWDDATDPTDADGYLRSDCFSAAFNGTIRTDMDRLRITSFDSTGFNFKGEIVGIESPQANYLALKWSNPSRIRMAIGNFAVSGATGLQAFNAFGFTPDLVLGQSTLLAAVDTLTDGATTAAAGYFVTGRYGSRAYTLRSREGLDLNPATSIATTRQEDVGLLTYDHTGAIAQRATWAGGTGSGGFYFDFSTATAGFLTALGLQIIPTPPPGASGQPAPQARAGDGRARRVVTAAIRRAARMGRVLRVVLRQRMLADRKRRSRGPEPAMGVRIETDPDRRQGDNAFPGSWKGGNASAGSTMGDSA